MGPPGPQPVLHQPGGVGLGLAAVPVPAASLTPPLPAINGPSAFARALPPPVAVTPAVRPVAPGAPTLPGIALLPSAVVSPAPSVEPPLGIATLQRGVLQLIRSATLPTPAVLSIARGGWMALAGTVFSGRPGEPAVSRAMARATKTLVRTSTLHPTVPGTIGCSRDVGLRISAIRHSSRAVGHVTYHGVTLAVARVRVAAVSPQRAKALDHRAALLGASRLQSLLDAVGELTAADPAAVFAAIGRLPCAVIQSRAAGSRYLAAVVRQMAIGSDPHIARRGTKHVHHMVPGTIKYSNDESRRESIPIEWDLVARHVLGETPTYAMWCAKIETLVHRLGRSLLTGPAYLGRYPGEEEFLLSAIARIDVHDPRLRQGPDAEAAEVLTGHAGHLVTEVRPAFLHAARTAGIPAADIGSPAFQQQLHVAIAGIDIASPYRAHALGFAAQWQAGSGTGQQGTGGEATVSTAPWTDLVTAVAQSLGCDPSILAPVMDAVTTRVLTLWAANVRGESIDGDLWGQVPRQHQSAEPLRRPLHLLLALLNDGALIDAERMLVRRAVLGALADPKQMVSVMALLDDVARLRLPRERFLRILVEADVYRDRFGTLVAGADLYIPLRTQDRDHGKNGYGAKIELAFITATALRGESIATIPTDPQLRRRRCDYVVNGDTYVELKSLAEGDMALLADLIETRVEDAIGQIHQTAQDLPGGAGRQRRVVVILPTDREPLLDAAMAAERLLTAADGDAFLLCDALQDALAQCQQVGATLAIALVAFDRGAATIREIRSVTPVMGLPAQIQAVFGGSQQRAGVSALLAQLTTAIYRRYGNRPRIAAHH